MNHLRTLLRLLILSLVLSACVPTVQSPTTDGAAAQPTAEQTLILASGRNLGSGNPHAYDSSMVLLDLVYEPLVRYAPDGSIVPALAESWEISADGLTWIFNLRQGVTFHDGTRFDATAAKWNLERWVGNEAHNWLPTTTRITSVESPDDSTLVLTLAQSYYPAMQDFTLIRPVRFLSPAAVDGEGVFAQPIGTGPWQVDTLTDEAATLSRYVDYWGEAPALDKIDIEVVLDAQTRIAALLSGDVHAIGGEYLGSIPPESMAALEASDDIHVLTAEGATSFYLAANHGQPPFDDLRVRQAVNHAIDRQGLVDAIFGGRAESATGLLPAVIPYITRTDVDLYNYDPDQAAALLAEAGWIPNADGILEKDGQPLQLNLMVDQSRLPQTASMATAIQAQLKAVGIALELRLYDYSGWLDSFYAKDYDLIMRFSWGPPYDPHTLLAGAFYTDESTESTVSYASPDLDPLIDAVLVTTDESERQVLYDQIWQHLDEQAAVIPLVYAERVYGVRNEVQGFRLGGTEYDLSYAVQEVTLAE
ncbi:MAG: nickel ABC transporter substrate-binding protein [Caldilineaceae bacterium]